MGLQLTDYTAGFSDVGLFVFGATAPPWARDSSFTSFLDHTHTDAPLS